MPTPISIDRAPVLAIWATVVAHRLSFQWDEVLSLGSALAGLNAQFKGAAAGHLQTPRGEDEGRPRA